MSKICRNAGIASFLLCVYCLTVRSGETLQMPPLRPIFHKVSGCVQGLNAVVRNDGTILVCFSTRQVTSSKTMILKGVPAVIATSQVGLVYWTESKDGVHWTFPLPIPGQDNGSVSHPALCLDSAGQAHAVWMYYGGPQKGAFPVFATFAGGTWSALGRIPFNRNTAAVYPQYFALNQTPDGRYWLFTQQGNRKQLFAASCAENAFGAFSSFEEIDALPWSEAILRPFQQTKERPGILAANVYAYNECVEISWNKTKWEIQTVPVCQRAEAPFKDLFGGFLTEAKNHSVLSGASNDTVFCDAFVPNGHGRALIRVVRQRDESSPGAAHWSLPEIIYCDGAPYSHERLWLPYRNQVLMLALNGNRFEQFSATVPFNFPEPSFSVFHRTENKNPPEAGETPGLDIVFPIEDAKYMLLPDEPSVKAAALARVTESFAGNVTWSVDGVVRAMAAYNELELNLGPHTLTATLGASRITRHVTVEPFKIDVQISGFSVRQDEETFPRNDKIENLQKAGEPAPRLFQGGDNLEF